jgi:uncharacterized protein YggE
MPFLVRTLWMALGIAASVVVAVPVQSQERPASLVTVSGEATIAVAPDMAELRSGVTTQGKTAREASAANARAMTSVLAALKEAGIAGEDIQTTRLSIQPVQDRNRPGAERITGFQASNQITIRMRDVTRVGDILDRLVTAGANEFGGLDFFVSAPSKLLDSVRPQAILDARRKADIYARAAGLELGRAVSIIEEGVAPPIPLRAAARAAPATPVAPGQETLRATVTVSFELLR